ncbi:MAG: cell wall hydrolase [Rhizobiaceae bacterium]|nr:cell wall hydrolase [Rhizobiaceae bacterium]
MLALATRLKTPLLLCAMASPLFLYACSQSTQMFSASEIKNAVTPKFLRASYTEKDKECMARAMFFESHRSSRDGMIAVGTVVMNRKRSGDYPDTVCGVVGQKNQFAPGVLTRKMPDLPDVQEAAVAVLEGERHPKLKNAMHFHTAGLKFKYNNMHYVTVAGGNAFYEKRTRNWQPLPAEDNVSVMVASAEDPDPVLTIAPSTAMALAAPARRKADVITAAMPVPADRGARVAANRPLVVEPVAAALPAATALPAYQPATNDPADIDPARFQ